MSVKPVGSGHGTGALEIASMADGAMPRVQLFPGRRFGGSSLAGIPLLRAKEGGIEVASEQVLELSLRDGRSLYLPRHVIYPREEQVCRSALKRTVILRMNRCDGAH